VHIRLIVTFVGIVMALGTAVVAQGVRDGLPLVGETGQATFLGHCAPCHGRDGKGDGPVASVLQAAPPDLTTLAVRTGPSFSHARLAAYLLGRGRPSAAHGTSEMPVWGPLFRELNPSPSRIDVRLERLVDYLESIQVKPNAPR
jgi:hypothetical protein